MSKSIPDAFQFNGDQAKYELFWDTHVNDLRNAGISYLLSDNHLELLRKEVKAPAFPRLGTKQTRKAQWDLLLCKYRDQCSRRENDLKKIEPDFDKAIALLTNRLTEDIRPTIKHVLLSPEYSNEKKYTAVRSLLLTRHGPNNQNDVERIKARLKAGSDQYGYPRLFNLHDDCVLQLSTIPKRDSDGKIHKDHEGKIIINKPDSQELRAIFLLQLAKHNKHFENLAIEACAHPDTYTYEYLRDYITNVVKTNPEKYDPASLQPLPESSTSPTGAAVAFNSTIATSNNCLNCKSTAHRTSDCPSTVCGALGCGRKFNTVRERKNHWWDNHSQNRRGPDARTKTGRTYAAQETLPTSMQSAQHHDQRKFWEQRRERSRSRDRGSTDFHTKRKERSRSRDREWNFQSSTPKPHQSEKHVKFHNQSNHAYVDSLLEQVPEDQIREWVKIRLNRANATPNAAHDDSY